MAINNRNYAAYARLFLTNALLIHTAQQFDADYRSTADSGAKLVRLSPTADGKWAAEVTFDSHQHPADSPTHTACTAWDITLYLTPRGNDYRIGQPPPGYRASYQPCS